MPTCTSRRVSSAGVLVLGMTTDLCGKLMLIREAGLGIFCRCGTQSREEQHQETRVASAGEEPDPDCAPASVKEEWAKPEQRTTARHLRGLYKQWLCSKVRVRIRG